MQIDTELKKIYDNIQSITGNIFYTHASTVSAALKTLQTSLTNIASSLQMPDTWADEVSVEISDATSTSISSLITACIEPLTGVIEPTGPLVETLKQQILNHIKAVENYNNTEASLSYERNKEPSPNQYKYKMKNAQGEIVTNDQLYRADHQEWQIRCEGLQNMMDAYRKDAETNATEARQQISILKGMLVPGGNYSSALASSYGGAIIKSIDETTPEGYRLVGIKVFSKDNVLLEETYEIYNGDKLIETHNVSYNEDKTITKQYLIYNDIGEVKESGTIYFSENRVKTNQVYSIVLSDGSVKYANKTYNEDGTYLETYSIKKLNGEEEEIVAEGINKYASDGTPIDLKAEIRASSADTEYKTNFVTKEEAVEYYKKKFHLTDAAAEQMVADELAGNKIEVEKMPEIKTTSGDKAQYDSNQEIANNDEKKFVSSTMSLKEYAKYKNMSERDIANLEAKGLNEVGSFETKEEAIKFYMEQRGLPESAAKDLVNFAIEKGTCLIGEEIPGTPITESAVEQLDSLELNVGNEEKNENIELQPEEKNIPQFSSEEEAINYYKTHYGMTDVAAEQEVAKNLALDKIEIIPEESIDLKINAEENLALDNENDLLQDDTYKFQGISETENGGLNITTDKGNGILNPDGTGTFEDEYGGVTEYKLDPISGKMQIYYNGNHMGEADEITGSMTIMVGGKELKFPYGDKMYFDMMYTALDDVLQNEGYSPEEALEIIQKYALGEDISPVANFNSKLDDKQISIIFDMNDLENENAGLGSEIVGPETETAGLGSEIAGPETETAGLGEGNTVFDLMKNNPDDTFKGKYVDPYYNLEVDYQIGDDNKVSLIDANGNINEIPPSSYNCNYVIEYNDAGETKQIIIPYEGGGDINNGITQDILENVLAAVHEKTYGGESAASVEDVGKAMLEAQLEGNFTFDRYGVELKIVDYSE